MKKTIKVYVRKSDATKAVRKFQDKNTSQVFVTLFQLRNGWHVAVQSGVRFDSYASFLSEANRQFNLV